MEFVKVREKDLSTLENKIDQILDIMTRNKIVRTPLTDSLTFNRFFEEYSFMKKQITRYNKNSIFGIKSHQQIAVSKPK
ncbi:hypothetical protein JGH11_12535 [Dysgonomonas sp. Marseille-P4677]|uniref:hypothetical protein n=1 Tax=Dysgonomonas sp. Marseille-P4677 TaxID=2364790 RepID=UPI0019145289|nr:hypothetical protein [Dysgonomonas sp. Marseille-P4677]MBK5721699.1 hypothetical protein [Dysgonomonas sp. Marseille-P4677]